MFYKINIRNCTKISIHGCLIRTQVNIKKKKYTATKKTHPNGLVFNATFNNISVISWRSVVLVVPGENHY